MERRRPGISQQSPRASTVMIDHQRASFLVSAFMEQIRIWYPVLHAQYNTEFVQAITSYFPPSAGSCLSLLILAIGCVAECETTMDAVRRSAGAIYIQASMEMLPCVGTSGRNSARRKFLRTQYYAFKASIYRPAVYEVLSAGEASDDLRLHASKFFTSYAEFAISAANAVTVCKPNAWTLYTSVFTISMATLAALAEPCLSEAAAIPGVSRGLQLAAEILANMVDVSPSLREMSVILNDRVFQGNVGAV